MAGGVAPAGDGTKSPTKIAANIFISFIGSGVLGLPYAFKEAGVLEGVVVLVLVAIISVKAMLLVIDCKYALTEKPSLASSKASRKSKNREELEDLIDGLQAADDEEIIPKALWGSDLSYGDVGFHAFGNFGQLLVEWAIILSQTGFCCAYLLFISTNLSNYIQVHQNYWLLALIPLEFCLCLIGNLKRLAFTSLFAQISNLMAFGVVFWFDFDEFHKVKANIPLKEWSWEGLPFFLCVAIYCYEGAGMILSLEASLHKDIRNKFQCYFLTVIALVTLLYATFGACGYLSFGRDTKDIITLNLPKPEGGGVDFSTIVTSCLCLSLFFTYPIMMFPVSSIIDRKVGITPETPKKLLSILIRAVMVVITGVVVLIIPNFGNLMALIGATCCIWLAFILPAVFHMKICARTITTFDKAIDYIIIGMGIVGTIVGLIDTMRRMSGNIDSTEKTATPMVCLNPNGCSTTPSLPLSFTEEVLAATLGKAVSNITSALNP
ncbi:uncharacterized protein [Watersipora subatra]|uniref:uncharacterized protein n=1 Tax=Watersipora subatra TaxID=2589382 RepID=UPI00355C5C7E